MQALRGAGVSPAIFLISAHCKNAGETLAPQHMARQAHCVIRRPIITLY
jgi:hypothetical protein